jgi:agmatinase
MTDSVAVPLKDADARSEDTASSMFGVAVKEHLIDPDASIQIGIRTPLPPEPKLHVLTADRCLRMDGKTIAELIVEVVRTRKCYITLDVDAMDPAYAGGTGTPAPGGLTSAAARNPVAFKGRQCHWR